MAYGNELMFVLGWPVLTRLAREYVNGPEYSSTLPPGVEDEAPEFVNTDYDSLEDDDEARSEWKYTVSGFAGVQVDEQLRQVHLRLIRARFDPSAYLGQDRYILANTPRGPREFSPFSIGGAGDEDEPPTYGISIVSRYFPVWVDWAHSSGGSHVPIVLNEPVMEMADEARSAIAEVIPEIATAPLAIVLTHY
jgi:hypothetical protein